MTDSLIRARARSGPRLRLLRAGARVGLACALLMVPGLPDHALAQDPGGRQFPLYVSVEGEYIKTTIALRLPYQSYGQPARALATRTLDEDERLFLGFVEAVRANDLKALVKVFGVPERSPEAPKADGVTTPPRTPEQTLAIYRQSFGGFEDVRVEGRVVLDDGALFVWSTNTAKGRMIRGSVVKTFGGRRQTADVTMDQPIETLIVNSLNRLTTEELAGTAPAAAAARVHILPLTKSGVELRFAGSRPETTVPGKAATGPLVAIAERAVAAQNQSLERYLAVHTPKSTQKLKQWFGTMNREGVASYLTEYGRPRQVRLLMDGGTVLLVFSAVKSAGSPPGRDVRYDYVVREGAAFKIANVLYASFLDDVLKNTSVVAAFLEQATPSK
jgi:hypothetical protein